MAIEPPESVASPGRTPGPAALFRYCPRCGREGPRIAEGRGLHCGHCDFLFFFNSAVAAGAFVFHGAKLVLCIRAKDPGKGMLDVAGGFIEFDESVEEGLKREVLEELNLVAGEFQYLVSAPNDYLYAGVPYKTTDLFYLCEAPDISGIRPADDVEGFTLMSPEDVDPARFAFASTRKAFAALLDRLGKSGKRG